MICQMIYQINCFLLREKTVENDKAIGSGDRVDFQIAN